MQKTSPRVEKTIWRRGNSPIVSRRIPRRQQTADEIHQLAVVQPALHRAFLRPVRTNAVALFRLRTNRAERHVGLHDVATRKNVPRLHNRIAKWKILTKSKASFFDYGGTIDSRGVHWSEIIWDGYRDASIPVGKEQFRECYVYAERELARTRHILPQHNFFDLLLIKNAHRIKLPARQQSHP